MATKEQIETLKEIIFELRLKPFTFTRYNLIVKLQRQLGKMVHGVNK